MMPSLKFLPRKLIYHVCKAYDELKELFGCDAVDEIVVDGRRKKPNEVCCQLGIISRFVEETDNVPKSMLFTVAQSQVRSLVGDPQSFSTSRANLP